MSNPIDIPKRKTIDETDLDDLFSLKKEINFAIEKYIELRLDVSLRTFYNDLSRQLTQKIVEEVDKSTAKIVEKIIK